MAIETAGAAFHGLMHHGPTCLQVLKSKSVADRELRQTKEKIHQVCERLKQIEDSFLEEVRVARPLVCALEVLAETYSDALQGKVYHEQNIEDAKHMRLPVSHLTEVSAWKWSVGYYTKELHHARDEVDKEMQTLMTLLKEDERNLACHSNLPRSKPVAAVAEPVVEEAPTISDCGQRLESSIDDMPQKFPDASYAVLHGLTERQELTSSIGYILSYDRTAEKQYTLLVTNEKLRVAESCLMSIAEHMSLLSQDEDAKIRCDSLATESTMDQTPNADSALPLSEEDSSEFGDALESSFDSMASFKSVEELEVLEDLHTAAQIRELPQCAHAAASAVEDSEGSVSFDARSSCQALQQVDLVEIQAHAASSASATPPRQPIYTPGMNVVLSELNSCPEFNAHVAMVMRYLGGPDRRYNVLVVDAEGPKMLTPRESSLAWTSLSMSSSEQAACAAPTAPRRRKSVEIPVRVVPEEPTRERRRSCPGRGNTCRAQIPVHVEVVSSATAETLKEGDRVLI